MTKVYYQHVIEVFETHIESMSERKLLNMRIRDNTTRNARRLLVYFLDRHGYSITKIHKLTHINRDTLLSYRNLSKSFVKFPKMEPHFNELYQKLNTQLNGTQSAN